MIVVEEPGLHTTVQDLGRRGLAHLGVPRSGAADRFSLQLANALVGNTERGGAAGAAVLETTLVGPRLRFETDVVVALTGAPAAAELNGEPVELGVAFGVRAGDVLRVGRAVAGLHTYVAVAGGVAVEAVLGSRSTDTLSNLGPPPLRAGDVVRVAAAERSPLGTCASAAVLEWVLPDPRRPVRVIPGPDVHWFADAALDVLCGEEFVVSPTTNRVGARLVGAPLRRTGTGEVPTAGMVVGAIQVPPDEAPIVLLADHAVTGGYPVIAAVTSADLPLVAQARPGTKLRFAAVSLAEARNAWDAAEALLASVRNS